MLKSRHFCSLVLKSLLFFLVMGILSAESSHGKSFHSPFYDPARGWSIAAVFQSNSLISQIKIRVVEGIPTDCKELGVPPSVMPCRKNAVTYTHTCYYDGPARRAVCELKYAERPVSVRNSLNGSQVSYQAIATTGSGEISDDEVTFTSRLEPSSSIATPIWWHRLRPRRLSLGIGLFPADYETKGYEKFSNALNGLLTSVFFGSESFALKYSEERARRIFDLWVAPRGAVADGDLPRFPDSFRNLRSIFNASVVLHDREFPNARDASTIAFGGEASVYAPVDEHSRDPWVFVHESGHFLFGLGDEYVGGGAETPVQYPCPGDRFAESRCTNVFRCPEACSSFADLFGLDRKKCISRSATGDPGDLPPGDVERIFRIGDKRPELMRAAGLKSRFNFASEKCVESIIAACSRRGCYSGVTR